MSTERLSTRIDAALRGQAGAIVDGPAFSAEDIVRAGRVAVLRRRVAAIGTATVAVVVTATAGFAALPRNEAVPPAGPPVAPSTSPTPPAPGGTPIAEYGIDVYAGNVIVLAGGGRVSLPFPADQVGSVVRTPNAWVVESEGLWLVPDFKQPSLIGSLWGPVISADGRLLVASTGYTAVAIDLTSLAEVGRTTFESGVAVQAVGIHSDMVLLKGAQGGPGPSGAAVWNLATGALTDTADESVWVWGMSADGQVLRRVDERGAGPKSVISACIDVVPIGQPLPVDRTGQCTDAAMAMVGGDISPDGEWVYLNSGQPEVPFAGLVATADLRAGRWEPVPDFVPLRPLFWDTDGSYLARGVDIEDGYFRCAMAGRCASLVLPADLADPQPIPRYGE